MMKLDALKRYDFDAPEYVELYEAANATAFQHPGWLRPLYDLLVPASGAEPLIIVGRDEATGKLLLVLPLLRWPGNSIGYAFLGVTDYACAVAVPGSLASPTTLRMNLHGAMGNPGRISISPVREEHICEWHALLGSEPAKLSFAAHMLPLPSRQDVLSGLHFKGRMRNDLSRKLRRLGSSLVLKSVRGESVRQAFTEARAFRYGRFNDDPLQTEQGFEFYVEVATEGQKSGFSSTFVLTEGGRTVAILFGLIDRASFRYLILACNYETYKWASPGLQMFNNAIMHWSMQGGSAFDFTIGDEPYKNELGCVAVPMFGFTAGC